MTARISPTIYFLLIATFASAAAFGQDAVLPLPPTQETSQGELHRLRQRMDEYERELHQLRTQVRQQTPDGSFVGFQATGNATYDHATYGNVVADGNLPLEEVEIQTKPNHRFRGRLYFDHVMFDDAPALGVDRMNETGFDTARMGMLGNISENIKYQIEVEFEGTETDFKTVYIQLTDLPWLGNIRLGHFYDPIAGLDEISGTLYQMFMERSLAITAFVPSRSYGYMAFDTWEYPDVYWAVGMFRHEADDSPVGRGTVLGDRGDWSVSTRIAWTLYYDEPSDGRYLMHLGFGYSYRTDSTVVALGTRSELGDQGGFLATTVPGDRNYSLFVPEFLTVWGPWSLQSEFMVAAAGSADFWGGYVEASYFLTGDHRGYDRDQKLMARPYVVEDFFSIRTAEGLIHGLGAWEVKARWSHVDMTQGVGAMRGKQNNFAAGLNWYLNSYARIMFDYVYEDVQLVSGLSGSTNSFGTRFQVHW